MQSKQQDAVHCGGEGGTTIHRLPLELRSVVVGFVAAQMESVTRASRPCRVLPSPAISYRVDDPLTEERKVAKTRSRKESSPVSLRLGISFNVVFCKEDRTGHKHLYPQQTGDCPRI